MFTIEHCENLQLQITPEAMRAIAETLAQATLRDFFTPGVQTRAPFTTHALPAVGENWPGEGGRYAGTMPARGDKPAYHLVLATGAKESIQWGPYDHDVEGAMDHYDGFANTRALIEDAKAHPVAKWANEVREGYADWYLPSHNELMLMWITVPHLFEKQGWYWSSTQYSPYYAWAQVFEGGGSYIDSKNCELRAVAVRRLVL